MPFLANKKISQISQIWSINGCFKVLFSDVYKKPSILKVCFRTIIERTVVESCHGVHDYNVIIEFTLYSKPIVRCRSYSSSMLACYWVDSIWNIYLVEFQLLCGTNPPFVCILLFPCLTIWVKIYDDFYLMQLFLIALKRDRVRDVQDWRP